MEAQIESLATSDACSTQLSGEIQYLRFSVPVPRGRSLIDVHLGFRRSTDLDAADKPGQDYAIARGADGYVVGIVADGVGQSFYGNLAASFLSERLLEYLWGSRAAPPTEEMMNEALARFQSEMKESIEQYELPENLPSLLRQALETTRRVDGSQAVFSAFILRGRDGACHLYQVGDVVAVARRSGRSADQSGVETIKADPKGRWSSSGRTKLRLLFTVHSGIERILLKSDGAKGWGDSLADEDVGEESFRAAAAELADYDDVSFVAAFVRPDPSPSRLNGGEKAETPLPPAAPPEFWGDDDGGAGGESGWSSTIAGDGKELARHAALDGHHVESHALLPRIRWRPYAAIFTAGLLVGASIMLLLYCFLTWTRLIRRVPVGTFVQRAARETPSGHLRQDRCGGRAYAAAAAPYASAAGRAVTTASTGHGGGRNARDVRPDARAGVREIALGQAAHRGTA